MAIKTEALWYWLEQSLRVHNLLSAKTVEYFLGADGVNFLFKGKSQFLCLYILH